MEIFSSASSITNLNLFLCVGANNLLPPSNWRILFKQNNQRCTSCPRTVGVPLEVGDEAGISAGAADEVSQDRGLEIETQVCDAIDVESGDVEVPQVTDEISAQVLKLSELPAINVQEVDEAHTYTPPTTINNLKAPLFLKLATSSLLLLLFFTSLLHSVCSSKTCQFPILDGGSLQSVNF